MCPYICLSLCLGPRPIAPPSFNEPQIRQELLEYYHHCHRKPGEPKLIPQLLLNYPITQQTPRLEMYLQCYKANYNTLYCYTIQI